MRKITKEVCQALKALKPRNIGNTTVAITAGDNPHGKVYLHGNLIAYYSPKEKSLALSLAGWNTPTTRERLNGIFKEFFPLSGFGFAQRQGKAWLVLHAEKHTLLDVNAWVYINTDSGLFSFGTNSSLPQA